MSIKLRRARAFIILLIVSFLLVISWVLISPCPTTIDMATDKPFFIDSVWPPPDARIPAGCYIRRSLSWPIPIVKWITTTQPGNEDDPTPSIVVGIYPEQIVEELDERFYFSKRVFLYIDGKKSGTPKDMLEKQLDIVAHSEEEWVRNSSIPGWYYFGWYPILFPGEHTARFVILKKDGTTLEYEWEFTIAWW